MVGMTIIFFIVTMILISTLFYLVIYAFVMDLSLAKDIIVNSVKLSLSKKNRNEFIEEYHKLLNTSLKNIAAEIVQTKDKELAADLEIDDIEKVKAFKKSLTEVISDKTYEFMSYEDVRDYLNEEKIFNFTSQIYINTRLYSNPQMLLLYKNIRKYKDGKLTELALYEEIRKALNMSSSRAKLELESLKKVNNKSLSVLANLVFAKDVKENRVDNFQKMYNAIA
ncbi:hypothetical protein DB321_06125 [Ligilactobacillus salivarius]|uniref:Uncharacterized protein n=4 Tax=Ligilactobacillus salivarius TaxID=1624 RepID=V6DHU0_9LACO|nr:hypothetical protein [Ligilactobacillus salivarius]CDK34297.1 hypothetical protein LSCP400_00941 [Ligilactobacillus salivarius cp400]ATP38209.1 hypothetical protein CR531_08540 [Ligilactobacillus salivarius]ATP38534.1 hypothetical protein CR531_10375 [Ligilactobacillus salivarius]EEJ73559.1 hypothetical protein HMPREF0545_1527 [Ligilactobacillus salivarius DSM 20555 = ATCC 11741]MBE7938599.1 hypothetical protein [Ligilactobacillus salivarius]